MIKFSASSDNKNIGKIEYEYSLLAKKCNIEMPKTKLANKKYFMAKRFDRDLHGLEKIHTVSAMGLLEADFRTPFIDYLALLQLAKILTNDMSEVLKVYRLMIFNILIGNKDDHSKNFAFQFYNDCWHLSPAFDILPSFGFLNEHSTSINGSGNPKLSDIFSLAKEIEIPEKIAKNEFEFLNETIKKDEMMNYLPD